MLKVRVTFTGLRKPDFDETSTLLKATLKKYKVNPDDCEFINGGLKHPQGKGYSGVIVEIADDVDNKEQIEDFISRTLAVDTKEFHILQD